MKSPADQQTDFRWRDVFGWRLLLLSVLSVSGYVFLVTLFAKLWLSPTGKDDTYAVLMPPGSSFIEAVTLATNSGGFLIDMNPNTSVASMIVKRSDAVDALYQSGAWMVVDPAKLGDGGFGGLCISRPVRQ